MKISPARTAAFDILRRIETEKAFSSVLLPKYERELSPNDRALCHEICLGVLRSRIYLDRLIGVYTNNKKLDLEVRIALWIGLYQIGFLDRVPGYSAVSESVDLVRRARKASAKGLVNAVLRNAAREPAKISYSDEMDRLSAESSHPKWLLERWAGQFGNAAARELAAANNQRPPAAFRFTNNTDRQDGFAGPDGIRKSEFAEGCFIADRVTPELIAAAEDGTIYFQDEGSQIVGAAVGLCGGSRFLDVCASPGSKTTQIAARHAKSGKMAVFVAGDLYWPRVEFLRDNCLTQGVEFVNVAAYDAARLLPFEERSFDTVLVDAPCSGTGTIRHNPEIRYFLEPGDFPQLSSKQLRILENASKVVRGGGKLIYSTCSLEREENEAVCAGFLQNTGDFRIIRPAVPESFLTQDGFARTFPHRDNTDGFFIAAFERFV